jgi:serine protease Do
MRRHAMCCAMVLLLFLAQGAVAQQEITDQRRNALVQAIEKVSPAVVSINVVVQRGSSPFDRGFWDFFYLPTPRYRKVDSIGSGFLIDPRGYILTNYHVIEDADYLESVVLPGGRVLEAEFIGADPRTDVAVLKAEGEDLPFVTFGDSDDLMIGEWVIAIGNPFGGLIQDPEPSVSVGVVSATRRRLSPSVGRGERLYQNMIQTDAAVNPGNSGGPLVNALGKVIGMNTMIFSSSGGNVGLGFAIPIMRARRVADEIIAHGRRRDAWPGFRVEDVASLPRGLLAEQGIVAQSGCLVVNILRDAPAYAEGLRPGDVVTGINGETVNTSSDIDFAVWDLFVGDTVTLDADRRGEKRTFRFPLAELSR